MTQANEATSKKIVGKKFFDPIGLFGDP